MNNQENILRKKEGVIKVINIEIDIVDLIDSYQLKLNELRYFNIDENGNLVSEVLDRLLLEELIDNEVINYIESNELELQYTSNCEYKIFDNTIFVKAEVRGV